MAKRVTEKKNEKSNKKGKPQQKPNLFVRIGSFFKQLRKELKKVSWPDRLKLKRTAAVTFAIILTVVVLIAATDGILQGLLKLSGFDKAPADRTVQTTAAAETVPDASETTGSSAAETAAAETTAAGTSAN